MLRFFNGSILDIVVSSLNVGWDIVCAVVDHAGLIEVFKKSVRQSGSILVLR
jgi:hypothetical protein